MNNETMAGSLVLVHPQLENDPAGMQGQVGVLMYAGKDDENVVGFPNVGEAIYVGRSLLMLKDKQEVLNDLTQNGISMPEEDFKAMYKIMMRQEMGNSSALYNALEIARDNPTIWDKTLERVNQTEKIALEKTYTR